MSARAERAAAAALAAAYALFAAGILLAVATRDDRSAAGRMIDAGLVGMLLVLVPVAVLAFLTGDDA